MKIDKVILFSISIITFFIMVLLILFSGFAILEQWVSIIIDIISSILGIGTAVTFTKSVVFSTRTKNVSKDKNELKIDGQAKVNQATLLTQQGEVINNYTNNDNADIIKSIQLFTDAVVKIQQNNTAEIVKLTIEKLEKESKTVDKPSDDWMMKFFRYSQEISDIDFQKIWSNILFHEMKNPKSIKIRALEELSRMSKDELVILEKLSIYSFKFGNIIGIPTEYTNDIKFIELSQLTDIGLLKAESFMTWSMTINSKQQSNLINRNLIILFFNETEKNIDVNISVRGYTEIGMQIIKSIGLSSSDEEFKKFAQHLKEKNTEVKITLHKINYIKNDSINYQLQDLL